MRLIDRLRSGEKQRGQYGNQWWPDMVSGPWGSGFPLIQTQPGGKTETIGTDFQGYVQAIMQSPPAFAAQMKRARYLSQARFTWKNKSTGKLFGTSALDLLERPWPNGTTGELLSKMEWHEGLAGNAFAVLRRGRAGDQQIKIARPDWVTILLGSHQEPEHAADQLDAEIIGYIYTPGGIGNGGQSQTLLPGDVAHWSPLPDPIAPFRGMSWITPLVRELSGDIATSEHKIRFFQNGATPNLVVKGIPAANSEEFKRIVRLMEDEHAGVANAYKTLYLTAGADATVVGSNFKDMAFKDLQGAGETRIAAVSEVPASLLGISEGMQGSSLNAGNYREARRSFIDGWFASSLRSLAQCLDGIVPSPSDAELALDPSQMPLLREDEGDAAEIRAKDAQTTRTLLDAGFDPDAALDAVLTGDLSKLSGKHSGLFSVQLQAPGQNEPPKGEPDA